MNRTQKDNRDHGKLSSKRSLALGCTRIPSQVQVVLKNTFQAALQIENASGNYRRTRTCLRNARTRASGHLIQACQEASSSRESVMASGAPHSIRNCRTRLRAVLTQAVLTAKTANIHSSASNFLC